MLHKDTVTGRTLELIKELSADKKLESFTLVGGTSLALQIGHRKSIDIDLFAKEPFNSKSVAEHVKTAYPVGLIGIRENHVAGYIDGIKIEMLTHAYPDVKPPINEEGIRMASMEDIAAMKAHAIHRDGSRLKDFVDMYHMLEYMPMEKVLQAYHTKYPNGASDQTLKQAMAYHDEIKLDDKIHTFRRGLLLGKVLERIKRALEEPGKTFEPPKQLDFRPDMPDGITRRRKRRMRE